MQLYALRRDLVQQVHDGAWSRARNALEAIMLLDAPAWAALAALIDECPTIHAAVGSAGRSLRSIAADDRQFISRNSQIAMAREFLESLPATLMF
jgi:hypothetical protein